MTELRRCIGSAKFGIEAHEAAVVDFPVQPSQKDGLGRMCKPHWSQYTIELRKAALARSREATAQSAAGEAASPAPIRGRKGKARARESAAVGATTIGEA